MSITSKQMFENAKNQLNQSRENLEQFQEELEDLENELKVEERIKVELEDKKDELAEDQKYIVMALTDNEIPLLKNKIVETEKDIKLLAKKCEVLSRDTWMF